MHDLHIRHLLLLALLPACSTPQASSFDVQHDLKVDIAPGAKDVKIWFAMPSDDPAQTVAGFTVDCDAKTEIVRDASGNKFVYARLQNPTANAVMIKTRFKITRAEVKADIDPKKTRPLTATEKDEMRQYLAPSTHIVIDAGIRELAASITRGDDNPITASRKLYDWVLDNVSYWVKHPDRMKASGVGSSTYCLANKTGNCTDFHSLYTALSRASGIPTRMIYGSFFKGPLNGADRDQSYHCWPEFFAPGIGWIPLDVAVADLFVDDFEIDDANREKVALTLADGYHGPDRAMVDYYFGNIDSRRVSWNVGRDLKLTPASSNGPVNALPKAYVEIDGKVHDGWTRKLTFKEAR